MIILLRICHLLRCPVFQNRLNFLCNFFCTCQVVGKIIAAFPPFYRPLKIYSIIKGGTDNGGTPLAFVFGEFGSVGYDIGFESLR